MAMQRERGEGNRGEGKRDRHGQNVLCMPYLIIFDILRSFWAAAAATS